MWTCNKCGEYRFGDVGECHCQKFEITDENGDECDAIYAMDEEDAARKHAEKANVGGDYYLMGESEVIKVGGRQFRISAEPDVHYSATPL